VVFQEEMDTYSSATGKRSEIVEFPRDAEELQEEIQKMEEMDAYSSTTGERSEIVEFPHEAEELQEEIQEMKEMDVEEANDPPSLQDQRLFAILKLIDKLLGGKMIRYP
jgi:uncharacterized coiled-coil DUF342 family protein